MFTYAYLIILSAIIPILSIADRTNDEAINSITFQYAPNISQTNIFTILDWILTFADIAGFAAIGLVVTMIYFQSRQRKFTGLIEILKLLNGKEQREPEECYLKHIANTRRRTMILFLKTNTIENM
jgi:uncharacterized membrane protein YciS (DUF1049 family)